MDSKWLIWPLSTWYMGCWRPSFGMPHTIYKQIEKCVHPVGQQKSIYLNQRDGGIQKRTVTTSIHWHPPTNQLRLSPDTHTHIYIYTCIYIYTYIYIRVYIYIYSSQTHPKKNQGLQFSHCGATNSQGAERPELSGGGVWRRRPWRSLVGWFLRGIMEMHHSSFTIEWNWYHGISWQSVRQKFNYPHESEQQWAIQLFQPTWTSSGTWVIANRWKMISLYVTIGWYQPTFPHSPIKSQRMWEEFNIETSH